MTNRQRRVAVRAAEIRAVVAAVFAHEGAGEPAVAVSVLDDAAITAVNARWLGHDWATDAIAFSYEDDPAPDGVRGEVLVSAETAAREARARRLDPRRELLLYVAHGTLHLLGWNDDTPRRRAAMNARAARILDAALPGDARPRSRAAGPRVRGTGPKTRGTGPQTRGTGRPARGARRR